MKTDASQAQERPTALAGSLEGKKTAILDKARETKGKAKKMMDTYLDSDSDGVDGFEFLTMAEAGEVGHWKVLRQMAESAQDRQVVELVSWGIPIQERHLQDAQAACLKLAAEEDPKERSS